ncbi:Neuromedin-K receptor, partial [Clonorchis sinensis]
MRVNCRLRKEGGIFCMIKIIKMLTFVVIMFGVCWLPSHVYFLLSDFTNLIDQLGPDNSRIAYGVCHWIAMSNSFVNPIIYLLMSKSFK